MTIPSMGPAVNNLFLTAAQTLEYAASALDANVPLTGERPVRSYVSVGIPPWDTENQLTVYATEPRLTRDFPNAWTEAVFQGAYQWVSDLVVTLYRPYVLGLLKSNGELLAPSDINAASAILYAEGWAMYLSVINGWFGCQGIEGNPCAGAFAVTPLRPINVEGASAGWEFTMSVEVGLGPCSVDLPELP